MRYPDIRTQGTVTGSGVMEAGCTSSPVSNNPELSGLFQTQSKIIALRLCLLSVKFEDSWEKAHSAA